MSIDVIHETPRYIVVNKPAGIIVIPDQYTDKDNTLVGEVSARAGQKVWVVHRIDRDTTGIVIFAKDAEAHAFLCRQFEKGEVQKKYITLVNGRVASDTGMIDTPIKIEGRNVRLVDHGRPDRENRPGVKDSLTLYTVKERFRDFTLLEVELKTGRRHQVRVHMWSLGHPLAVDPEYTHKESLFLSEFKRGYKGKAGEKPLLGRLSLHAWTLSCKEPGSDAVVRFEAPLPKDFEVTLKQLRKYNHG